MRKKILDTMSLPEEKELLAIHRNWAVLSIVLLILSSCICLSLFSLGLCKDLSVLHYQFINSIPFAGRNGAIGAAVLFCITGFGYTIGMRYSDASQKAIACIFGFLTLLYFAEIATSTSGFGSKPINNACNLTFAALILGLSSVLALRTTLNGLFYLYFVGIWQAIIAVVLCVRSADVLSPGCLISISGTEPAYMLSLIMSCCLPICVFLASKSRNLYSLFFHFLVFILMLAVMISVWNKGSMIASALAIAFICHRFRGPRTYLFCAAGLACILGSICLFFRPEYFNFALVDEKTFQYWRNGWSIFLKNWCFGVGVGHLNIPVEVGGSSTVKFEIMYQPRNLILFVLDELGLIGGIAMGIFIVLIFQMAKSIVTEEIGVVTAILLAFFVSGVTSTPYGGVDSVVGSMLLAMITGLAVKSSPICMTGFCPMSQKKSEEGDVSMLTV